MKRKKTKLDPRYMPVGGVPADQSKQVPNNSYDAPPTYYVDKTFKCIDCGAEETWSATDQKVWYEERKGSLYSTAVRCTECRKRKQEHRRRSIEAMNEKKSREQESSA